MRAFTALIPLQCRKALWFLIRLEFLKFIYLSISNRISAAIMLNKPDINQIHQLLLYMLLSLMSDSNSHLEVYLRIFKILGYLYVIVEWTFWSLQSPSLFDIWQNHWLAIESNKADGYQSHETAKVGLDPWSAFEKEDYGLPVHI